MARMSQELRDRLILHISRKCWWHCPPRDPRAYEKRGKFYASSFEEAEFWGRPADVPARVNVRNPLIGDERTIMAGLRLPTLKANRPIEERFALDARMKEAAVRLGYDSILLMTPKAFAGYKATGKIPRSLELNALEP
jgi:hypothetical protein